MATEFTATVKDLNSIMKVSNIESIEGNINFSDGSTFKKNYATMCGKEVTVTKSGNVFKYNNITVPANWLTNIKPKQSPWEDVVIDTLIQVSPDGEPDTWFNAYFESYDNYDGVVNVFSGGRTSKTQQGTDPYSFFRRN